jgi:L-amino acid N-acyltransferase YncA
VAGRSGNDVIRSALPSDAESVLAIYRDYVFNSAVTFETEVPSVDEMRTRIAHALESHAWLVQGRPPQVNGYAYATRFHPRPAYRWSTEVSVYVGSGAHGRGIGGALLENLLATLKARGYVNAFAGIALPNPASVRLFETRGFEQVALQKKVGYKLGRWRDVGWWQLRLAPASNPPPLIE